MESDEDNPSDIKADERELIPDEESIKGCTTSSIKGHGGNPPCEEGKCQEGLDSKNLFSAAHL